jgi:hypothetical protein
MSAVRGFAARLAAFAAFSLLATSARPAVAHAAPTCMTATLATYGAMAQAGETCSFANFDFRFEDLLGYSQSGRIVFRPDMTQIVVTPFTTGIVGSLGSGMVGFRFDFGSQLLTASTQAQPNRCGVGNSLWCLVDRRELAFTVGGTYLLTTPRHEWTPYITRVDSAGFGDISLSVASTASAYESGTHVSLQSSGWGHRVWHIVDGQEKTYCPSSYCDWDGPGAAVLRFDARTQTGYGSQPEPVAGYATASLSSFELRYYVSTTMAPVPEPSTYVLLGSGLLTLGGIAVRRRKRADV